MANNLVANKTNELSVNGARELVVNIQSGLALVSKGYLMIAPDVQKLYDCKGYKALGYKNFDEMCTLEFGMSHGTTVGIRKVFEKFGTVTKENKYLIPEKYLEYGYTKLLLMSDKKFEENGINPLEAFTPDMTINDMKDALRNKLEEKAQKQEVEAIDTNATEVDTTATEVDNTTATEVEYTSEMEYDDLFNYTVDCVKGMQAKCDDIFKPEKMALFDAVLANLEDIRKEYKRLLKKSK